MTDFQIALRHYCRNPRCRSKLPAPVSNTREAFCTRGCHSSFYLHRCLNCEQAMTRRRSDQRYCTRPACQKASRYRGSQTPTIVQKKPIPCGLEQARLWRVVAGKPMTPSQLHCATVSDGPNDCEWSGGEYERIEAKYWAALKEVEEFIEPEWREVMSPDGVRCFVTRCREVITRVDGMPSDWSCAPRSPILDDLSIPEILKR